MNVIWLRKAPTDAFAEVARVTGPVGQMMAVWDEDALCQLAFAPDQEAYARGLKVLADQCGQMPEEIAADDPRRTALVSWLHASPFETTPQPAPFQVVGTPFQHSVWGLLLRSRPGQTFTYSQIAARLGNPGGARAVGGAVAANPLAVAIPCHRVLPSGGGLGGYRWGTENKARLLEIEAMKLSSRSRDADSDGV